MRGPFKGYDIAANRKLIGVVLKVVKRGKLLYDDPRPAARSRSRAGRPASRPS